MELKGKKIIATKVLVKKPKQGETTLASGIIIPNSADEKTSTGTVLLVGKSTPHIEMEVKVGDEVMFPPRAARLLYFEDEEYWELNVQDVLLYW